jgi:preprotein translocase subunit SecB
MEVKIQLNAFRVEELSLKAANVDIEKSGFSLEVGTEVPSTDNQNHFFVALKTELQLKEGYIVRLTHKSEFITDTPIDDEFRNSHFPRVNAPAIAFPFFRAFISTFLLNAGFEPIILPSINFTKLKDSVESNQ